jgi:hypothetical protein
MFAGLGGLFKSIGGFPGIFLGASLLDMALKKRGGKGLASLLPPGVNPQTMETTDYQGDPEKFKVFVNTLTDERFGTQEERDKDLEEVKKAADGGIMSTYSLGGMAEPQFGGLLRGPGTGTSDSIPGMIYQNGKPVQRAALSDGEFVFTNKAVKAAGGGSIEKGADAMYELMNKLERQA